VLLICVVCCQSVDIVPKTPSVLLPVDDFARASTPLVRSGMNIFVIIGPHTHSEA